MAVVTKNNDIKIFPKDTALFEAAAIDFTQRAIKAVCKKGIFNVVLAGGNTPQHFFEALTTIKFCQENTPWQKIQFFFGDERYVAADNPNNNYYMANKYLFSKVAIPAENIHPIPTELKDPNATAKQYGATLHKIFGELPEFDLIYLGLGEDGHTASLMPFNDILTTISNELVAALWITKLQMYRITLTPRIINNAAAIIFLVTGSNKASAVWEVIIGQPAPEQFPAQLIHCKNQKNIWYLDQAAAKKLST